MLHSKKKEMDIKRKFDLMSSEGYGSITTD